jgi:hypothetical protein
LSCCFLHKTCTVLLRSDADGSLVHGYVREDSTETLELAEAGRRRVPSKAGRRAGCLCCSPTGHIAGYLASCPRLRSAFCVTRPALSGQTARTQHGRSRRSDLGGPSASNGGCIRLDADGEITTADISATTTQNLDVTITAPRRRHITLMHLLYVEWRRVQRPCQRFAVDHDVNSVTKLSDAHLAGRRLR